MAKPYDITVGSELRPCYVNEKKALFHRWADIAYTVGAGLMVGGHAAGQVAYTVAIVELENGNVVKVHPKDIRFIDSAERFEGFYWPDEAEEHMEENND